MNRDKHENTAVRKLKSRSGETIAETLVALLIAALALVMLAGAIQAGTHIIDRSRDTFSDYYAQNEHLVKMDASGSGTDTARVTATSRFDGYTDSETFNLTVTTITNDTLKVPVVEYTLKLD